MRLYWRREWFRTFCDFQKWTHCFRADIFLRSSIPKNNQNRLRTCIASVAKFLFFLNRDLKNEYFQKFANTFLFHKKTITQKKIWNKIFSYFCFWPKQKKYKYFFSFLYFQLWKGSKKSFPPVTGLKKKFFGRF